ncbi:cell division protein [Lactobacillus jensenii]|nr:cell division protein [Lactobacillus jensenii]
MAKETEQVSLPFLNLGLFIFLELGYIPAWIQGQSMMAWGGAIVPWVLRYGIRMIKLKKDQINVIGLAVSMAIAAQTHNLTVAMLILALTPAFIVAFVKSNEKKKLFRDVIFSVIIFLFLSANIIGALLVLKTNNIAMPVPIDLKGIALNITPNLVQRNHITPLMLIVLIITAGLAIINFNKNKLNFWLGLGGASFFFLSTKAFPWGITERLLPFLKTSFQSPSRLTVIAYPLLLVSLSISLSSIAKRKNLRNIILKWGITGLAVIASISALFDFQAYLHSNTLAYLDNNVVVLYSWVYKVPKSRTTIREDMMSRNQGKLFQDLANSEPDYLPITKKIDSGQIVNIYGQKVVKNTDNFVRKVNKDGSLSLIWKQKKAGKKLLPIVMYKQSTLFLNRKKDRYKFESVAIPVVQARKGMNIATLKFNSPIWFIILLWISIISWIALIIYKGWMFCSKKRKFLQ